MNSRFRQILVCSLILAIAFPAWAQNSPTFGLSKSSIKMGPVYIGLIRDAADCIFKKNYTGASAKLDEADKIQPGLFDSLLLRADVYAETKDYGKARDLYQQAIKIQPNNFWPQFNLAELMLTEKKYKEARESFQALMISDKYKESVDYKVVVCLLGEGDMPKAKETLDKMKFPSDSGAYYYANAAYEFAQGHKDKGMQWIQSGDSIFSSVKNSQLYDVLADMGWVTVRPPSDK